jgi:hypothetical protein
VKEFAVRKRNLITRRIEQETFIERGRFNPGDVVEGDDCIPVESFDLSYCMSLKNTFRAGKEDKAVRSEEREFIREGQGLQFALYPPFFYNFR